MQLQDATAVRVRRHNLSKGGYARIVLPRHQEVRVTLREV